MLSIGTTRVNQTSDLDHSLLIWKNAAALVRFVVQSQYHQLNLPLKSFRSKLFYTVMKILQLLKYRLNLWSTGVHFVLFCICMFILVRNSLRRPTQWFILVSAFVMFALSTADISITFRLMTDNILLVDILEEYSHSSSRLKFLSVKCLIFVTNKSVFFPTSNMMSIASIS